MVSEGHINSAKYIEILKESLPPIFTSAHVDKNYHLFLEDDAPCYSAKTTQVWHLENGIQKLWWPSQSPTRYEPNWTYLAHPRFGYSKANTKGCQQRSSPSIYPGGVVENSDDPRWLNLWTRCQRESSTLHKLEGDKQDFKMLLS